MKDYSIAKAILIGSVVIGVSIIIGSFVIARAPRFEKTGTLELIDTRSGSVYTRTGSMGDGRPNYKMVPGPRSTGANVKVEQ